VTGIGRYTANLARQLCETVAPDNLSLYVTRDTGGLRDFPCRVVSAPVRTPHEVLRGVWEQTAVAADVRRFGADVYHSPNYALPLALTCPAVLTVHDLAYLSPHFHTWRLRHYLRLFTRISVRRARKVIAVSNYTREQIVRHYPEAEPKTVVVHNGLDPIYADVPSEAAVTHVLEQLGQRDPYILYTGTIEPRKNIPRIVQAFEAVAARSQTRFDLLICGAWGWRVEASRTAIEGSRFRDRIKLLGYLDAAQLPPLTAGARALVYPSLDEGFGFPALEAMAVGTPVIVSDRASLPEIVGDAGIQVDPFNVIAIAEAMEAVLFNRSLAADLAGKGFARARMFSWERAADETLAVYRSAVEQPALA